MKTKRSAKSYNEATYGDRVADVYDEWYGAGSGVDASVTVLKELAGSGRVLELGIGTGRLALPLSDTGIPVSGIDASKAMVAKLRAKPGGKRIPVRIGDFADVDVDGPFSLIFVAFNTFFAILSQDEQVRCFRNVASRLGPAGLFAIEAFVPDITRFDRGQRTQVNALIDDAVMLDVSSHDPLNQRISTRHVTITESGTKLYPVELRYAWPSELDLMARLAGMRLRERWNGWRREPFTADSGSHVSVYERI